MTDRFSQCTETCTTDCGHCKGHPVEALRADNERLARRLAGRFEETEKLRAEVAGLRQELDEARAELAGVHTAVHGADAERHKFPDGCADLTIEVQELIRERDPARMVMELVHERTAAEAERDRTRAVVDEVETWRWVLKPADAQRALASILAAVDRSATPADYEALAASRDKDDEEFDAAIHRRSATPDAEPARPNLVTSKTVRVPDATGCLHDHEEDFAPGLLVGPEDSAAEPAPSVPVDTAEEGRDA